MLALFRKTLRLNCSDCGAGCAKPEPEQTLLWTARGRCGGPFQPVSEGLPLAMDEGGRYYVTATQVSNDAGAPCYEGDQRFYSCPVAMTATPVVQQAVDGYNKAKRGMLETVGKPGKLTARYVALLECVEDAVTAYRAHENAKMEAEFEKNKNASPKPRRRK